MNGTDLVLDHTSSSTRKTTLTRRVRHRDCDTSPTFQESMHRKSDAGGKGDIALLGEERAAILYDLDPQTSRPPLRQMSDIASTQGFNIRP
jgi:hypothetical protein